MKKLFIVVVIVTSLLRQNIATSSECPEDCTCPDGQLKCRSASLTSVPSHLNNDAVDIDLSFNNIVSLGNNVFSKTPHLRTIAVSDNSIKTVLPEAFNGLDELRRVDLHNNKIEFIQPSIFRNNINLCVLDLSGNKLGSFQLDLNYTKLSLLNLSGNVLTSKTLYFFLPVTYLENLDLSNNQIETLNADVLHGMQCLKWLNISGNQDIEYDCRLRALYTLCSKRNITCITDDIQSLKMVNNMLCGPEEELVAMSLTDEAYGFINGSENTTEDSVYEASGMEPTEIVPYNKEFNPTEKEPTITSDVDWTFVVIVASCVCCAVIAIIVAVICIRRRRPSVETSRNISRTNSIDYLNQEDQFNRGYKNSRNDSNKICNHYDRVFPTEFNRDVLQFQVGDNIGAEVVRVPSFKTRSIATPLNLPQEISPQETELIVQNSGAEPDPIYVSPVNSLSRSIPVSHYEELETVRAGSIKYKNHGKVIRPDSQYAVPQKLRVSGAKRS